MTEAEITFVPADPSPDRSWDALLEAAAELLIALGDEDEDETSEGKSNGL